ncbi:MAG: hypothetical protein EOP45_09370 [Sphingobacteriaceae bacterium]|nr:MAG: hypothetical protein EOP45_09370 [Sphingobacteriaceae bacterium]
MVTFLTIFLVLNLNVLVRNTWETANLNGKFPFIPTVRTLQHIQGVDWDRTWNCAAPEILTWNEPERQGISPQVAAQFWYSHMVPLRQQRKKRLVSPSCANDDNGKRWINEFMNLVASQKPDFLGIHLYHNNADEAIRYLQAMHDKHQIPLYITEMASIDRNYKNVLEFTGKLCNFCDNTWWVERYALFAIMPRVADGFVSPAAQLLNSNGSFRDLLYKFIYDSPIHWENNSQAVAAGEGQNAYQ